MKFAVSVEVPVLPVKVNEPTWVEPSHKVTWVKSETELDAVLVILRPSLVKLTASLAALNLITPNVAVLPAATTV